MQACEFFTCCVRNKIFSQNSSHPVTLPRGLKGEYAVQSPAELKVDRELYLTCITKSSALHGAFGCPDARSAFGISHSRISWQMRRRHTRPRREHPILAVNNVASCTVIAKCMPWCICATSVSLYQPDSETAAGKHPSDINDQSFTVHVLEHRYNFTKMKQTDGPYTK